MEAQCEMYSAGLNDHELYQCRTMNLIISMKIMLVFSKHRTLLSDMAMEFFFSGIEYRSDHNLKKNVFVFVNMTYSISLNIIGLI